MLSAVEIIVVSVVGVAAILILPSIVSIAPTEVGLVRKRFGFAKLSKDSPVAFQGEPGYQADLLMPGLRLKFWILYSVTKFPWVQVPAGQIGVVIAQVGEPLPIGAKSAHYKPEFGNFGNLRSFVQNGGQKGVQRPVLPPGSLLPIHPVGFLVITKRDVYGIPVSPELRASVRVQGRLMPESFGLLPAHLDLVRIQPQPTGSEGAMVDMVGVVTTYEGEPLALETSPAGWADSPILRPWKPTRPRTPRSSRRFLGARAISTTTIRTCRRFWTPEGRSASSTIPSSTAPMPSIPSWYVSSWCPC